MQMLIAEMALVIGISSMEMKSTKKCECGFGRENVSEKKKKSCDFSMLKIRIDNTISLCSSLGAQYILLLPKLCLRYSYTFYI